MTTNDEMKLLLARREEFVAFLERRLRDRAVAEDVLQEAFVKALTKLHTLESAESLVPWFYRLLRTTLIDDRRRLATRRKALDALGSEPQSASFEDAPPRPCACVSGVVDAMKPEQAELLRRLTVDEVAVKDYAAELGITSGNAAVRSFRAREALREGIKKTCGACASRGCTDCSCKTSA